MAMTRFVEPADDPKRRTSKRGDGDGELPRRMLTTTEVANFLCLHPNTVRKWADRGLLRAVRLGPRRDRRFPPEEILRIIRENSERNQTTG